MWEALRISIKPDRKLSSGARWTENHIGSMISPLGKRSTCTRPAWIRRRPHRLDETVYLLKAEYSALSLLPARPLSSSTPFPQDAEAILTLPWSEPSVSLIFQTFLPKDLTSTTAHRSLNNLSRLTVQVGWGVLMFLLKPASMLKRSSKTCSMFLDLPSSPFALLCASHFTTGVHGGNKSWQHCPLLLVS